MNERARKKCIVIVVCVPIPPSNTLPLQSSAANHPANAPTIVDRDVAAPLRPVTSQRRPLTRTAPAAASGACHDPAAGLAEAGAAALTATEGRGDAEPKKLLNTPHATRATRSNRHPRKSRLVSNKL